MAKHVIANSPYALRKSNRLDGFVIPDFLSNSWSQAGDAGSLPTNPVLVAVNNGFGRLKNIRTLLKAFELVHLNVPDAKLILIGDEYEKDGPAHLWARKKALESGVTFAGRLTHAQIQEIILSASIFVHPSLEESFGFAVLEAMALGMPVIGGASSGAVPWLLDGGNTGILVNIRSPQEISEAILSLLGNTELRRILGARAKTRARNDFCLSISVDEYLLYFNKILDSRAA